MNLEFTGTFYFKSVIWINSLPPGQQGPSRRIIEDLGPYFELTGVKFPVVAPTTAAIFLQTLEQIEFAARQGARPILHFDMHGSEEGLEVGATGEIVPWHIIFSHLRSINVATRGNLCVIAGVCFALRAIEGVKISEACPVYILIAPEKEVSSGFLEDNIFNFYKELLSYGDIVRAYKQHLQSQLDMFSSEKFFVTVLTRHILHSCTGKGRAERQERLVTEILLAGQERSPENLKRIRRLVKEGSKPTQALVDNYARTFLVGRPCLLTVDDLIKFVTGARNN